MPRILVADDDANSVRILEKTLVHAHYEVTSARNGLEALTSIEANPPDLLLLDIMMPQVNGYGVIRKLREDERFATLPIIVISARDIAEDISRALDLGANDYLIKPFIHEVLLARVRTQLRLKDMQDQLARSNAELRAADALKSRMVSVVSHELRTPLTAIRGALDLVGRRLDPAVSAANLQLIHISLRNTDRLIRLVNDVLDFSRLSKVGLRLSRKPISLGEVAQQVVDELRALALPYDVTILLEVEPSLPEIEADADRMHQVISNLVSNAVKVTPQGNTVRVQVQRNVDELEVVVVDEGEGLSPEQIGRLFQPFQQLGRARNTLGGGTGLGLVISRELVELHGGRIEVSSVVGAGSRFSVHLPLSRPDPD